ncbi:MFS transporter [Actinomadura sp. ATCC 31491]|uniref:MFS transporter n=1 Tax=Actinomadura luzonensis TaxID=2805427 RepID=A0ABT0FTH1_9ACTN|nr:MFS transporter [Actinomadura luzonensis]MCK2215635.1 MFS transporter [Actinomadura luzonensis]
MTAPAPARPSARPPARPPARPSARPPIVTGPFVLRLFTVVGSSIGFFLPFAVVPEYVERSAGAAVAGAANAALLVTTVAVELAAPALVARFGYRWALGLGLLALGGPALVLLATSGAWAVLAVSVVRGAGFAVTVVAGGALTAELVPAARRGEGLALAGLVSGGCALLALPAGSWLAGTAGYGAVFAATAVLSVLPVLTVPFLPGRPPAAPRGAGVLAGLRAPRLTRPAMIFAASAAGTGVLCTFVPLAVRGGPAWLAPAALLAQSAAATLAKWAAGRSGDRRGHERLLLPGVVLSAVGLAAVSLTGWSACVLAGAAVFGAGFGILQNATLTLMYDRARPEMFSTVSALWNAAYDGGMAAGAFAVGLLAPLTGYPVALLVTAGLMATAALLAPPDGRATAARFIALVVTSASVRRRARTTG